MSAIFRLSKYILLPIYSEWIEASDFCHTDTAICNHVERRQFLQLIGHECVKFPGLSDDAVCTTYLTWIAARNLRITHLIIEKLILIRIFTKSLSSFVSLTHLVLQNYDSSFSKRLTQLLNVCTHLQSFELSTSKVFDCEIIESLSQNCKLLKSINLEHKTDSGCISLTDDDMIELAKSCQHLTVVKLTNFVNLTGGSIVALANYCHLEKIFVRNMPFLTAESLDILVNRCPDMTEISVENCTLFSISDYSRILSKCSKVETVSLRTDSGFRYNSGPKPKCLSMDALMHAVHVITLKLCSVNVTNEVLEMITIGCSGLRVLELTDQTYLTHDGFMHIAKHCRYLTELSLAFCNGVTDAVVATIANSKLRRLNINKCSALTDSSIQHIVNTCHSLTSLSIGGNYTYTLSTEVYAQLFNSCPKLLFLNASASYYTHCKKPQYTKKNGEVVEAQYRRSHEIPNELFTKVIKPDTALKELRVRGLSMRQDTLAMLKDTHKELKIIHGISMSYCMQYNPYDSD